MTEPLEFCILLLAVVLVINVWLIWRVLYPLRRLAQQANQLTAGEFSALETSCGGIAEIDALRRSMVAMVSHVRRSQEQSHVYADVLTRGQEAERTRIARELHDETVQLFIAIAQETDLTRALVENQPAKAVDLLKTIRIQAIDAVDNLRHLIADLRPPALEELGLVAALKMLAENSPQAQIHVTVEGIERRLNEEYELTFFRIAQEAVTNAQRHGGAKVIAIKVGYEPQQIVLTIEDDGSGFAMPKDFSQLAANGHYGLLGIHERVQGLRGTLQMLQLRPKGTQIKIAIPTAEVEQPDRVVHDPVCKAEIKPHQAYGSIHYEGKSYYFCCPVCQGAFQQNPTDYALSAR
ncbi:MAG: histidine kinase [Chloroflexi bacterium]|nr:histidine kinase [Chloroflexota bacterium]